MILGTTSRCGVCSGPDRSARAAENGSTCATSTNCSRTSTTLRLKYAKRRRRVRHVIGCSSADNGEPMKKPIKRSAEQRCPACRGTGFPPVKQPVKPGRRIFAARCAKCGGKGRVTGNRVSLALVKSKASQ
jgi:hypothetical protein